MPRPRLPLALLGLTLCGSGCLDWNAHERARGEDSPDSGGRGDDAANIPFDAGADGRASEVTNEGSDSAATLATGDAEAPDADSPDADAGDVTFDAGDPNACPASACPSAFPCVGTATDYACQGQYGEFRLPARNIRDSVETQGYEVDVTAGTVLDTATGLMWERITTGYITHPAGVAHCAELDLGGHHDWRLPSVHELVTWFAPDVVPSFDPRVIRQSANNFGAWSSTPENTRDRSYFQVNFASRYMGAQGEDAQAIVICVRTHASTVEGTPVSRFRSFAQGDAYFDSQTHLIWETTDHDDRSKAQADATCSSRTTDGRSYRLPSIAELVSIMDFSQAPGLRVPPMFSSRFEFYWTRTRAVDADSGPDDVVVVSRFGELETRVSSDATARAGVRCVSDE